MKKLLLGISIGLAASINMAATNDIELQQATEIIGLLKTHYVDGAQLDPKRLTDATVGGLLKFIGQGAQLLTAEEAKTKPVAEIKPCASAGQALARAEVIDPKIGYIRIADVEKNTVAELDAELSKFSAAKTTAYVLDLRFADGTNYTAAAELAGRFLRDGQELFTIHSAHQPPVPFRSDSQAATKLTDAPLMILVNHCTRGAAEALAGALRAQDRGIVIGAATAGQPLAWQDLPLSDGRVLRVATSKIALPKGRLFPDGVIPDIPVKIDPKQEQELVLHSPTNITLTASLQTQETHKMMTEADLVKYHRGEAFDLPTPTASTNATNTTNSSSSKPAAPRDIVLERAVDILKGIRVLLSWR